MLRSLDLLAVLSWFSAVPPIVRELLIYLLPVLIGAYATELGEVLQRWNTWLDHRGPKTKRVIVALLAFAGMKLAALVGVPTSQTGDFAAAALAYLFHLADRRKAAAEGTA